MLTFLGILLLGGALLAGTVIVLMARMLVSPPRMNDGKAAYVLKRLSPGDLQLPFEETSFDVRDERTGKRLRLAAWWIPHPNADGRCVILIHGHADAKVGAIAWAPTFHSLGLNILAIDLRGHGESDGTQTTAGYFERHDVGQIINAIRAERPGATRQVILFGVSLGAAVAAATAVMRDDLSAVILESPFTDFPTAAQTHAKHMGMPGAWLQRPAIRLAEWMTGADFAAVRPIDLIPRIPCPLMVIQSENDPLLPDGATQRIEQAVASRPPDAGLSLCWTVPGAGHVLALAKDPDQYRARLERFLSSLAEEATAAGPPRGFDTPPGSR